MRTCISGQNNVLQKFLQFISPLLKNNDFPFGMLNLFKLHPSAQTFTGRELPLFA